METYLSSLSNKQKSLLSAVQNQTFSDINLSLKEFPSFTEDTTFSYLLLIAALHRENQSISVLLIEKGCSATSSLKTNYYNTSLYYAVLTDNMKIFKLLYKNGASIHDTDANKETPLELMMMQHTPKFADFVLLNQSYDNVNPKCEEDVAIFHMACYKGNLEVMRKFVERNFSVNSRSNFRRKELSGATPIQLALKGNEEDAREDAVRFLLRLDVDFDTQDNQGNTILHSAIELFDKDPLQLSDPLFEDIILAYVNRYDQNKFINPTNQDGLSHFHILCSVDCGYNSDSTKLLNILKYFIERGVDLNSSNNAKRDENNQIPYYTGYTALHFAARNSRLNVLKLLLENGADPTKVDTAGNTPHWKQTYKNTPLHVLEFRNLEDSTEMAELLLKYGASVDVQNSQGDTPLHCAFYLREENEPLLQLLLGASRSNTNHVNTRGLSYLEIASTTDLDKVKSIVENGGSVKGYMNSALYFAIYHNRSEIVEYLLAHGADADTTISDFGDTSLLHFASIERLRKLYNKPYVEDDETRRFQANAVYRRRRECEDVDWSESRRNQTRIIELLLEHGALVDARNSMGVTPLFAVCDYGRFMTQGVWIAFDTPEYREILTRQMIVADVLIRHGADINSRDSSGESILHILSTRSDHDGRQLKLAEFLLERGADVDAVDNRNLTPLHFALKELIDFDDDDEEEDEMLHKHGSSFIGLFLKHGANVNSRDDELCTPVHLAVRYYHSEKGRDEIFVKLLNQHNIDLDAQDIFGNTPLHVAFCLRKHFCIKNLLDAGADVNLQDVSGQPPIFYLKKSLKNPYYTNSRTEKGICEIVITHIKILLRLGHFVDEKIKMHYKSLIEFMKMNPSTIDTKIDEEVKKLETLKVDKYTSLFQILRKHPNDLVKHAKNAVLEKIVSSARLREDFPLFFSCLKRQFRKASFRSHALESAKESLRIITRRNWPDSCSEQILRYLSNENLGLLTKSASIGGSAERSQKNLREGRESQAKLPRMA